MPKLSHQSFTDIRSSILLLLLTSGQTTSYNCVVFLRNNIPYAWSFWSATDCNYMPS